MNPFKFLLRKYYHLSKNAIQLGRAFYYAHLFKNFGKKSRVLGHIYVISPEKIDIGNNSILNEGVILNAYWGIKIGNNVHISTQAQILTAFLEKKPNPDGKRQHEGKGIVIEDGVWIGAGAIINPGVTIGKNTIIGAGAVLTKNAKSNSVYVGIPAILKNSI